MVSKTNALLSSFDTQCTQRYPREIADPDFQVVVCRAHRFLTTSTADRRADIISTTTRRDAPLPAAAPRRKLLERNKMNAKHVGKKKKTRTINQITFSRSLSRPDVTKGCVLESRDRLPHSEVKEARKFL